MVAPNILERQPVKRRFFHALNLIHRVPQCIFIRSCQILHVKLSAKELRREGDTLDEYKIVKTVKHTCLVVTFTCATR